jgi:OmpR family response regulator RpaB
MNSLENQKHTILVVDDEASIRGILAARLLMVGYHVVTAADGEAALETFRQAAPALVVLDVMMPKLDGYEVCQALRQVSSVPIIMLTALADVAERIPALELGADDYMVKPFSPKELEARICSILRRVGQSTSLTSSSDIIQGGPLRIDTNQQRVYKGDKCVRLTNLEFKLLEILVKQGGTAISRRDLLQQVWGDVPERYVDTRVVDVHITRLRAKVEAKPKEPELILTVRGTGYQFQHLDSKSAKTHQKSSTIYRSANP